MKEFVTNYIEHLSTFGQVAIILNILFFVLAGVIFKYIVIYRKLYIAQECMFIGFGV